VPDDVLIRRIAAHGSASWVMVFAGTIDRSDEARLTVLSDLCRDALNTLTVEPVVTPEVEVVEHESPAAAPSSDQGERRSAHRPFHAWIERLASQTIEEGGHASVIVISIPDEDARPEYIQAQVAKVRNELRPSDFAGGLSGGEIGVLLRDTPADRAAAVSARLEKLLQWDVTTGKAIQPSIGMVSCSADSRAKGRSCGPRVKTAPPARCASAGAITRISSECLDSYGQSCKMARRSDGPGHISHTLSHTAAQRPSLSATYDPCTVDPDRCPVMSAERRERLMSAS
jgi:FOG: GGDEF domain